jgi:hypothetical protein
LDSQEGLVCLVVEFSAVYVIGWNGRMSVIVEEGRIQEKRSDLI